jgi:hypothetical protein
MVVEFTNVVSSNPVHGKVYWIQLYVIKFVIDLRHVGGFLRVLRFPPPINLNVVLNFIGNMIGSNKWEDFIY